MLRIHPPQNLTAFEPGMEVEFQVEWQLTEAPTKLEVRLVWHTTGKGDRDMKVVQTISLESPGPQGSQPVVLTLPWGPYSFSGKLISLLWGVELVVLPSKDSIRLDLTIAPHGEEVAIDTLQTITPS